MKTTQRKMEIRLNIPNNYTRAAQVVFRDMCIAGYKAIIPHYGNLEDYESQETLYLYFKAIVASAQQCQEGLYKEIPGICCERYLEISNPEIKGNEYPIYKHDLEGTLLYEDHLFALEKMLDAAVKHSLWYGDIEDLHYSHLSIIVEIFNYAKDNNEAFAFVVELTSKDEESWGNQFRNIPQPI